MNKLIFIIIFSTFISINAQENNTNSTKNWTKKGTVLFSFNQASFSNWIAGGENAISGTVSINYDFNYKKENWAWDNKIMTKYGISNVSGTGTRKTDDHFEFISLISKIISKNWSYSFVANIRSQFTVGYDYTSPVKKNTSGFFSPGYITLGPGIVYKKSDNFNINLSPATTKTTFVTNEFAGQYGTRIGETSRYEFGFYTSIYYKTILMENVTVENIFNAYSNYLDKPQNIDLNYQINLIMQVNKYLSTNLNLHAIIDKQASSNVQFKQSFGLGVNYIFH